MKTVPFALLMLAASAVGAAPEVPPDAATEPYRLNVRSVFAGAEDARSPFWPIGWSPSKGAPAALSVPKVELDLTKFNLTSTLLGNPSLAVINGRAYTEGETLKGTRAALKMNTPAAGGTPLPKVRVQRIVDGSVILECQGKLITLALNRPSFAPRKEQPGLMDEEEEE